MKRLIAATGIVAALAAPSIATAKPTKADRAEARSECRTLLDAAGSRANLALLMDSSNRRAFKACVRSRSRDAAHERRSSRAQAREECGAESGRDYGRCVREQRRAIGEELDAEDAERAELVAGCSELSGREFGHCVARAASDGHGSQGLDHAEQAPQDHEDGGDAGGTAGPETGAEHSQDGRSHAPSTVPPTA